MDEEEGSHAGTLVRFLNKVAEDVEREFPNVMVEGLAYQYTRKTPKTAPRDNVIIRLCTIECSFAVPLADPRNADFQCDMDGWSKLAKHLYVWDYVTNYDDYIGPHPNWRAIGDNIKYFANSNAIGVFEEGEGHDFCEMKNWVMFKKLWNPELKTEDLMDDFCKGYYGPEAAPYVMEYHKLLMDRMAETGVELGCFRTQSFMWLDIKTLNRATELMNTAIEGAENAHGHDSPKVERLLKSKTSVDSVWMPRYYMLKADSDVSGVPFLGPADFAAAARNFADAFHKYDYSDLDIYTKHDATESWLDMLQKGETVQYPVSFNATDWLFKGTGLAGSGELSLVANAGSRSEAFYTAESWKAPGILTVDFNFAESEGAESGGNGPEDQGVPSFGIAFMASDTDNYSYILFTPRGLYVNCRGHKGVCTKHYDEERFKISRGEWHRLTLELPDKYMRIHMDRHNLVPWCSYPLETSGEGAIGFFTEGSNARVRNIFMSGPKTVQTLTK